MDGGSVTTGAGTRFYISDDQVEDTLAGFRSIDNWVEVEQVKSISEFGVESEDIIRMAIGRERGDHIKGVRSPVGLNVIVGHDPFDDGQDEFNIAEGLTVQFAFRIVIPISDEVNNVIYFQALVRSNKLAVGTTSDVVRRNYACTLNSEIVTVVDVTNNIFASFQGAGRLTASLRMRVGVAANYAGAGILTGSLSLRQRVSATFAGTGNLVANIRIPTQGDNFLVSASFAGVGILTAPVNLRQRVAATFAGAGGLSAQITIGTVAQPAFQANAFQNNAFQTTVVSNVWTVSASFNGAGNLVANITIGAFVGNVWTVSANFQGAGNLSASLRQQNKVAASFNGAGRLTADLTVITHFLLLRDGVSKLLLHDGVSRLRLGH